MLMRYILPYCSTLIPEAPYYRTSLKTEILRGSKKEAIRTHMLARMSMSGNHLTKSKRLAHHLVVLPVCTFKEAHGGSLNEASRPKIWRYAERRAATVGLLRYVRSIVTKKANMPVESKYGHIT